MKPAGLAVPPRDVVQVPTSRMVRERALISAVDETYFRIPLEPGQGIVSGAATTVDSTTLGFTFEDLSAAAATALRVKRVLRDLWPRTYVRLNVLYTAPVGSTNNFTIGLRLRQVGAGSSLAAAPLVTSLDVTLPGPAVANDILSGTLRAPVAVLPALQVCEFTLRRGAPDANPNAFRLVMAEFVLEEVA